MNNELNKTIEELSTELITLRAEKATLEKTVRDFEIRLNNQTERCRCYDENNTSLREANMKLELIIDEFEVENIGLLKENAELKEQNERLSKGLAEYMKKNSELRYELEDAQIIKTDRKIKSIEIYFAD